MLYIGETDKLLPEICRLNKKCLFQSLQDLTMHIRFTKFCRQLLSKIYHSLVFLFIENDEIALFSKKIKQ